MQNSTSKLKRERRHKKIRAKVFGTAKRPRLSVFRSNRHITAQIIDDVSGKTIIATSPKDMTGKGLEKIKALGTILAKKALAKKVSQVVFDRGGFVYAGKVKALAEGARAGGLKF